MKDIRSQLYLIVFLLVSFTYITSCSDMYGYKEYVEDGEITYTGKVDSITAYSGENRVLIEGLFISDPKITETRIYWNNSRDSVVVPVERTNGVDTLRTVIDDLSEGSYNFEVVTYDGEGNPSIPVHVNGEAFGERYIASLLNRPITANELFAGDLMTTIRFGGMDRSSGVFATEIQYLDSNDQEQTAMISIDDEELLLEDYKIGTEFNYRTYFLPTSTSIDTFITDYSSASPELVYLKNTGNPFEYDTWDGGRWGILADWITNDDVKNAGGYGGYELRGGTGVLSLEGGWGLPEVTNGKIYQVVTLPAGQYSFSAEAETGAAGTKYLSVATGGELPDVENVPAESIAQVEITESGTASIEFELTENTQVALGFVGHMPDTGTWFKVLQVNFNKIDE